MRSALIALLVLLLGCAPRLRTALDPSPIVRKIEFEGNGSALQGTSDFSLRAAMAQGDSPTGWRYAPLQRAVRLDPDTLRTDAWRIETWYAHHGYFDARFLGWEVVSKVRPRRVPLLTLVGHVDQGPASLVQDVSWRLEGTETDPDGFAKVVGAPVAGLIRRQASVQVGTRFSLAAHDSTRDMTLASLRDQSFARATVSAQVDVCLGGVGTDAAQRDLDQIAAAGDGEAPPFCVGKADGVYIRYLANPGPPCRFGEVTLQGETSLPEDTVRDAIQIKAGDRFSSRALAETQRDLFALGTFSVVNVVPELQRDDVPANVVPVRIELQKSRWRQLRLGAGVELADGTQDLHVSSEFKHVNLLNRLWNFEVDAQGGYTWLARFSDFIATTPPVDDPTRLSGGPTAELSLGLDIPRFPGPNWRLEYDASVELGVAETNQFFEPAGSVSLVWRPKARWTVTGGVHGQFHDYFNTTVDLTELASTTTKGTAALDFRDPYLLTYLTQSVLYDSRNDVLFPTRGAYGTFHVDEAGPPGQYSYIRTEAEGRSYRPLGPALDRLFGWHPRLFWANRLGGGWIKPYKLFGDERAAVPYAERLTLGGSNSVRGWAIDHLGPYIYTCDVASGGCASAPEAAECDESTGLCKSSPDVAICDAAKGCEVETIPIGGMVSALASTELRGYWRETYGIVVFADIGMAWNTWDGISKILPVPSLGLGLRYKTPVGPLRLDVARRMGDLPMFRHEPRYAVYFSLSEAF